MRKLTPHGRSHQFCDALMMTVGYHHQQRQSRRLFFTRSGDGDHQGGGDGSGSSFLGNMRQIAVRMGALKSEEEMGTLSHLAPLLPKKELPKAAGRAAPTLGGSQGSHIVSSSHHHGKETSSPIVSSGATSSRSFMKQSEVLWSQAAQSPHVELRLPPIPSHIRPGELVIRLSTSGDELLIGTKMATAGNGKIKPLATWRFYRSFQIPSYAIASRVEAAKILGVSVGLREAELANGEDPGYELQWKFDGQDSRPVVQLMKKPEDVGEEWPCLFEFPYENFTGNTFTASSSSKTLPLFLSEEDFSALLSQEFNDHHLDEAMKEVQWFEGRYGIRVEKDTIDLSTFSKMELERREAIRGLNADVKKLLNEISSTATSGKMVQEKDIASFPLLTMGRYLMLNWLSFARGALLSLELGEASGHSLPITKSSSPSSDGMPGTLIQNEEFVASHEETLATAELIQEALEELQHQEEDDNSGGAGESNGDENHDEKSNSGGGGDPRLAVHLLKLAAINHQDSAATIHLYNLLSSQFPEQQQLAGLLLWRKAMLPDNRSPFPILGSESSNNSEAPVTNTIAAGDIDGLINSFVGDLHEMGHPGFRQMLAPTIFFWQRAFVAGDRSAAAKIARALLMGEVRGIHGQVLRDEREEGETRLHQKSGTGKMKKVDLFSHVGELWLKAALDAGSPLANFVQSELIKAHQTIEGEGDDGGLSAQQAIYFANKAYAASPQLMDRVIEMEDDV